MNETVCDAYSNLGPAAMEDFLYGSEGLPYNSDHQLDAFIFCVALRCGEVYCQGIGL